MKSTKVKPDEILWIKYGQNKSTAYLEATSPRLIDRPAITTCIIKFQNELNVSNYIHDVDVYG